MTTVTKRKDNFICLRSERYAPFILYTCVGRAFDLAGTHLTSTSFDCLGMHEIDEALDCANFKTKGTAYKILFSRFEGNYLLYIICFIQ